MTSRDDMEAVVRRELTQAAMLDWLKPGTTTAMNTSTQLIMAAADAYRRGRPNAEPDPLAIAATPHPDLGWTDRVVHWQSPGRPPNTAICHGRVTTALVTSQRHRVTCGTCTQSPAWQEIPA